MKAYCSGIQTVGTLFSGTGKNCLKERKMKRVRNSSKGDLVTLHH